MSKITEQQVHQWVVALHDQCDAALTKKERDEQHKYATLVQRPGDKIFLSRLLDESSQIRDNKLLARRIKELIRQYGVPEFFSTGDKFLLRAYNAFGYLFHPIAIPIFKKRLRTETDTVIIHEERPILTGHLKERDTQHIGQNVNLLGEVVLGDQEADNRYRHYLKALEEPDINYISIKISGIYAQIHPLNFKQSRQDLIDRLTAIYQKAIDFPYVDEHGVSTPKFVNLDMEEYKDAHLTLDVFKTTLSLPQFKHYRAGIVVQAYLPDAWNFQTELLEFAHKRVADGGSPLKMRLVKGANLQMETVISSLKGWENPVLGHKVDVDANYLHIIDRAFEPENIKVLNVGIASHNLFSIGYAYLLSQKNGLAEGVTFEMLEGMANQLWRVMKTKGADIILYTPVVKDENFLNAVSYLVRRLDENTGPENFLSYSFNLKPGTEQWEFLENQFRQACAMKDSMDSYATRKQNRNIPVPEGEVSDEFANEPDTNFDLKPNQEWAENISSKWCKKESNPIIIPLQVGADEIITEKRHKYYDRSTGDTICVYEMSLADESAAESIVKVAAGDPMKWRETTIEERHRILHKTASLLAGRRGDLIGCMAAVTGKTFNEGDVEVSEAIDFCRFYPITMKKFMELDTVTMAPKGVVTVVPPWNFPLAIPVGGVAAALSGGNAVILKPATVAAPVAWEFAKAFWDAGVPREALQVVITDGRKPLKHLTDDPAIRHIIFTGGTDTAILLNRSRPSRPIAAETGGKNCIILTSCGDRDKAVMNVVASAFGNAGQKCSACSLLLVEREIYEDESFRSKLRDAAMSMQTGSVWNFSNVIGPMVTNANDKLLHAIEHLEEGESWLVAPEFLDEKHYILRPTIKWGVKPDSYTFRTELFAPLLGVVCIDSLEEGIRLVNSLEYGLTSGLQSLNEDEQTLWKNSIMAGNLYINRGITGAIVNRQPFGGMKMSALGGGIKAGGVNYTSCFVDIADNSGRNEAQALESYRRAWAAEFSAPRDVNNLYGEQNVFRYLPLESCVLRVTKKDKLEDIRLIALAAGVTKTPLTISIDPTDRDAGQLDGLGCAVVKETLDQFLAGMGKWERIRTCSPEIPDQIYFRAAELTKYVATAPVVKEGRIELLHYVKEQSIANEYHRYGSITEIPPVS